MIRREEVIIKSVINKIGVGDANSDIYICQMFDGCDNTGTESWVINMVVKGKDQVLVKYDLYLDIRGNLSGFDTKKNLSFRNSKQINDYLRNSKYKKIKLMELFDMFKINTIQY